MTGVAPFVRVTVMTTPVIPLLLIQMFTVSMGCGRKLNDCPEENEPDDVVTKTCGDFFVPGWHTHAAILVLPRGLVVPSGHVAHDAVAAFMYIPDAHLQSSMELLPDVVIDVLSTGHVAHTLEPGFTEYLPVVHAVHAADSPIDAPVAFENLPAAQSVHTPVELVASTSPYLPIAHAVHATPASDVPIGQSHPASLS